MGGWYIDYAKRLLDLRPTADLPNGLAAELNRINAMLEKTGASLSSRQVVASVVSMWFWDSD
jgi:hypothetical protein